MALRPGSAAWYGFVVVDPPFEVLAVGQSVTVPIWFLSWPEALEVFQLGEQIAFGDGVTTIGTLVIERWLEGV